MSDILYKYPLKEGVIMKLKVYIVSIFILLIFMVSLPTYAGNTNSGSQWEFQPYLRLWGVDVACLYKGFTLIDGLDTRLWVSLGGGVESIGFYRNPDGTPYAPPVNGTNLGAFTRTNYLGTVGLDQGLIYDEENHRNLVDLIMYYRSSSESYTETDGTPARIFDSGLPDRSGIQQNSLLAGIQYHGITVNSNNQVRKGYHAETTFEFAPKSFNETADFSRWNTTVTGFWPVAENDNYAIYAGGRFMYDRLYGNYIPINARSSFGGASVFPGIITMGLGSAMRGINTGRFDGYDKLVNNLEMRCNFPSLLKTGRIMPGVIVYYDLGCTDNLDHNLNLAQTYSSTGVALVGHLNLAFIELDLGLSYDCFLTEQRESLNLLAYLQF